MTDITEVILRFKYFVIFVLILLACFSASSAKVSKMKLGIDVLIESGFSQVKNKNIALLTNNSGRTGRGVLTLDVLLGTKKCKLIKIFTPEHGFYSKVPAGKAVSNDTIKGLPVYSLYGANRRPSKWQFDGVDAVVVDLQDVGVRSYTYISTIYKVMDACAEYDVPIIILDRPNPLGGNIVDGNLVEKGKETFVGIAPVPYIHGLTVGEFAHLVNNEGLLTKDKWGNQRKCSLTVVKMENWFRWMRWEDTKLKWFATSPNIPSVDAVRGMAVVGVLGELGKFNIGIGTDFPFQFIAYPKLTDYIIKIFLGTKEFAGVTLHNCHFKDLKPKKTSSNIRGYKLKFNADSHFAPYTIGIKLLLTIRKSDPKLFREENFKKSKEMFCKVTGTDEIFKKLMDGTDDFQILNEATKGLREFSEIRSRYLFYE